MLNLTTFAGKGGTLTYDDIDNNWLAIQNAFNASILLPSNLYKLANFNAVNTCMPDGSNNLVIHGNIQFLTNSSLLPRLQLIVTLNNKVVKAFDLSNYFIGNTYPFVANDEGGDLDLTVNIPSNAYPATVNVYVLDQFLNYAQQTALVIKYNPCAALAEVITLNSSVTAGGNLTVNMTIANGSNDFRAQYYDGAAWQNLGSFVHVDGTFAQVIAYSISGTHDVRIIDTLTNNVSNVISTNF